MARTIEMSFTGLFAMLAFLITFASSASAATISYCSSQNTANMDPMFWTWQSNGWCSDKCRAQSMAFAIVLTNNCWCSNYIPDEQEDTSECNDDCPGFPQEKCGNKDKNLYGYIELGEPSGTQGASQPSATSPSSALPSPISSSQEVNQPKPTTVVETVTAPAPITSTPPPSSEASTTLQTTSSKASVSAAPEQTGYTSVRVITVSGAVHTETVVNQPNTTGAPALSQSQKKSTPVGAIVGGVIGGLALIAIIVGLLWFFHSKRKKEREENDAGDQSGVQRNVSTMSKAGLLRSENHYPQYPPQIATTFHSSKRNSRMDLDNNSISPISASDRRSSRPVIFDQRLNPSAIMILDNGSRGSFASLDDSHDYGRALNVTNPDPYPRDSIDTRRSQNPPA